MPRPRAFMAGLAQAALELAVAILCALLLCACAATQQPPPECAQPYVILPDNFIIDLAAGSTVVLDPAAAEFTLFCDAAKARESLANAAPDLPGAWRVYRLKEHFAEIGGVRGRDYVLARPAEVADWLDS